MVSLAGEVGGVERWEVSFHKFTRRSYRSLFIHIGLFSFIYTSLVTSTVPGVRWCPWQGGREGLSVGRSLFTHLHVVFIGLFSYI